MSFFDNLCRPLQAALNISNCSFCDVAHTDIGICNPCLSAIEPVGNFCIRCASSFAKSGHDECGKCLKKPPVYQTVISAARYKFPIDKALSELKFNRQLHYARSLSHVLEKKIKQHYRDTHYPQTLIAIPLHPKRLKERGFNQSDIIAKQLAKSLAIPISNGLSRIKDTPHQIGLSEKQRRKNLSSAFYLQRSLPEHIALVDDVVTTGSTVTEAAKLCRKQGVKQVDVWCLAKT